MNEQMVKRREQNRRAKRLSQSEVHLCPMSNTIGLPVAGLICCMTSRKAEWSILTPSLTKKGTNQ
jgi:hypothetical protein